MAATIRIGTSGWNYKDWRGRFYPPKLPVARWLEHYAREFDTVEINNSFYRLGEPSTFEAWHRQAPAGFLFAVKCNRFLTHNLKLTKAAEPLERFMDRAVRLGEHLGPLLYQLPPHWKKNTARLDEFCGQLSKHIVHVMEFREPTWLAEDVYDVLRRHNVGLCVHDLLPNHPRLAFGPVAYLRFHGTMAKYRGAYGQSGLQPWVDWIRAAAEQGRPVYCYFNNDIEGHAVNDAKVLKELLGLR